MTTLKMICYRAQTALSNILMEPYKKAENEKRTLIKEMIFTKADIKPDFKNNQIEVNLHSMATPMKNQILAQICEELNQTETIFPGTNLKITCKTIAS